MENTKQYGYTHLSRCFDIISVDYNKGEIK